jgi:hypothetical protein
VKGHVVYFGCIGSRRGATHPKETRIHEGDIWIAYKRTREHNQEGIVRRERSTPNFLGRFRQGGPSSLKELSSSTWEDLCFLEIFLWTKLGRPSLV